MKGIKCFKSVLIITIEIKGVLGLDFKHNFKNKSLKKRGILPVGK